MTVFEVIKARRSIGKMKPERPPREKIERVLEAATYAPNHHISEPWRFFILSGKARAELGEILAEDLAAKLDETTSERAAALLLKERNKLMRSPVVVAVASVKPSQPKEVDVENVEATSAAVQNMLLVAQEEGLASMWRTGSGAYNKNVKAFLGLDPEDHLVGFVYLGYPANPVPQRIPTPFEAKSTWIGWDENGK